VVSSLLTSSFFFEDQTIVGSEATSASASFEPFHHSLPQTLSAENESPR
jgi:hypothetical protein